MIREFRAALQTGTVSPKQAASDALARANSNAGHNVYISLDPARVLKEAESLPSRFPGDKPPLYGLPISLKDLFDLAGYVTSSGSAFYAQRTAVVQEDSAVAARLREKGAAIVGKTHLHNLAYGITGENPDYGDCVQPPHSNRLTGGSSSGAAASVQEGSAVAAIGTDTGGSIRAPSALCGLAGYRASVDLAHEQGLWRGCVPLAPSFDTLGWIFRDLRDAPLLGEALFNLSMQPVPPKPVRVARVNNAFIRDCEPAVAEVFVRWENRLRESSAEIVPFDAKDWESAVEIFAPIQAHEAAAYHTARTGGDFSHFDPQIAERLKWGASIDLADIKTQKKRHAEFRKRMDALLADYDYLILPCGPLGRLTVGEDHSQARRRILRYTVPMSLAGTPVVTLPDTMGSSGAGVQLVAARGADARLLAFAAQFGI
jgi:Asp-tRNA(Asn)/Glu-tRNA(Gln) amidotransferase A subunit family amidase